MNRIRRTWLALLILAGFSGSACAVPQIGRVLLAIGDAGITRADDQAGRAALAAGDAVADGDLITTGARGGAQLRLADGTLIALSRDAALRVSAAERPAAACGPGIRFDLQHGLMRVVAAGGADAACRAYRIVTPDARFLASGARFSISACGADCRRENGAGAGTVAAAYGGTLRIETATGETIAGDGEIIEIARAAAVKRLTAPPAALSDRGVADAESAQNAMPSARNIGLRVRADAAGLDYPYPSWNPSRLTFLGQSDTLSSPAGVPVRETSALATSGIVGYSYSAGIPPLDTRGNVGTYTGGSIGINFGLRLANFALNWDIGGHSYNVSNGNGNDIPLTTDSASGTTGFSQGFTNAGRCSVCGTGGVSGAVDAVYASARIASDTGLGLAITLVTYDASAGEGTYQTQFFTSRATSTLPGAVIAVTAGAGINNTLSAGNLSVTVGSNGGLLTYDLGLYQQGPNKGSKGTSTDNILGSSLAAGNMVWGRWTGSGMSITMNDYNTYSSGTVNYITGNTVTQMPATGSNVIYSPIGGVVNGGAGGTFNGGTISVDFAARQVVLKDLSAKNTGSGLTFTMNGSAIYSSTTARFGSTFSSVTCSGGCPTTGTPSGSFSGHFFGANAEGLGIGFSAGYGTGNGVTGVQAFGK